MSLTRKHFKAIAEVISESKDKQEIIKKLTYYFQTQNQNFDKSKFIDACNNKQHGF